MSEINLNLYRVFCAVAKSKTYAEASGILNISIPAISININKLEDALETKLFLREKNGLKLTKNGKKLYEIANKALEKIDLGEKMILEKNDISNGEITIGCPSHIASFYLMNRIEKAMKDYPNLKIKLICGANYVELMNLLQNHKLNFVILDQIIETDDEFEIEEIKTLNNIFISKVPLKINKLEELEDFNYILNFENTISTKSLFEKLKKYGIEIKSTLECDTTELRIDAIKRNLGIGYAIKETAILELEKGELFEVELPIELPKIKINIICIKEQLTKVDKAFIRKYLKK